MISQTGLARPAAIIASVVALIAAASLALALSATASLPSPSPVAPLTIAATDQLSPRAVAQYRAFYAQQMASEAALERWSLPEVSARGRATQQQHFYAQQLASEAALERWSSSLPGSARAGLPEAPQPLTAGVQLK